LARRTGSKGAHRLSGFTVSWRAPEASLNAKSCCLGGCPQLRNSLGQPASRFGRAARPDLLSPAGAEIGLLPGDGIVVVNGQECVDVQQVERTISNSMSCSLKVKRGLSDTDRQ